MNREEAISFSRPQILKLVLAAFANTYHGDIEEDTLLDHGWDSLDLIEIIMEVEEGLNADIYDAFIDSVIKDVNEIDKLTAGGLVDKYLCALTDEQVYALESHISRPMDRLQIDLQAE